MKEEKRKKSICFYYKRFRIIDIENLMEKSLFTSIGTVPESDAKIDIASTLYYVLTNNIRHERIVKTSLTRLLTESSFISSLRTSNYNHTTLNVDKVSQIINAFISAIYSNQIKQLIINFQEMNKIIKYIDLNKLTENLKAFNQLDDSCRISIITDDIWNYIDGLKNLSYLYKSKEAEEEYKKQITKVLLILVIASLYVDTKIFDNIEENYAEFITSNDVDKLEEFKKLSNKKYTNIATLDILRTLPIYEILKLDLGTTNVIKNYVDNTIIELPISSTNISVNDKFTLNFEVVLNRLMLITLGLVKINEKHHFMSYNNGTKNESYDFTSRQYELIKTMLNSINTFDENELAVADTFIDILKSNDKTKYEIINHVITIFNKMDDTEEMQFNRMLSMCLVLYNYGRSDILERINKMLEEEITNTKENNMDNQVHDLSLNNSSIYRANELDKIRMMLDFIIKESILPDEARLENIKSNITKSSKYNFVEIEEILIEE